MNSRDTSGQMSVQCESMNVSTTVLPRKLASETRRPDWSVSVKPGAVTGGTGESCIMSASEVLTLAGIPVGRKCAGSFLACSLVTAKANTVANAMPPSSAPPYSRIEDRLGRADRFRAHGPGRATRTRHGILAGARSAGQGVASGCGRSLQLLGADGRPGPRAVRLPASPPARDRRPAGHVPAGRNAALPRRLVRREPS